MRRAHLATPRTMILTPCHRARARLSQQVDAPLPRFEADALASHLDGCAACRAAADRFVAAAAALDVAATAGAPRPPEVPVLRARAHRTGQPWAGASPAHRHRRGARRWVTRPLLSRTLGGVLATAVLFAAGLGTGVVLRPGNADRPIPPTTIPGSTATGLAGLTADLGSLDAPLYAYRTVPRALADDDRRAARIGPPAALAGPF